MLVDSPNTITVNAKGDSVASYYYLKQSDANCLTNIKPNDSFNITLPNSTLILSTVQEELSLSSHLSKQGKTAVVLPDLTSSSLISLGQLCNNGCNISLDKDKMNIYKNLKLIIEGTRNKTDSLWDIPILVISIQHNYKMPPLHSLYHKMNHTQSTIHPIPQFSAR